MRDDGENKSDEYSKRELDMLERQRYLEGVIVQLTAELTKIGGLLKASRQHYSLLAGLHEELRAEIEGKMSKNSNQRLTDSFAKGLQEICEGKDAQIVELTLLNEELLNYVSRLKDALRQTKQYIDDDCLATAREWIDASLTDEARSE